MKYGKYSVNLRELWRMVCAFHCETLHHILIFAEVAAIYKLTAKINYPNTVPLQHQECLNNSHVWFQRASSLLTVPLALQSNLASRATLSLKRSRPPRKENQTTTLCLLDETYPVLTELFTSAKPDPTREPLAWRALGELQQWRGRGSWRLY